MKQPETDFHTPDAPLFPLSWEPPTDIERNEILTYWGNTIPINRTIDKQVASFTADKEAHMENILQQRWKDTFTYLYIHQGINAFDAIVLHRLRQVYKAQDSSLADILKDLSQDKTNKRSTDFFIHDIPQLVEGSSIAASPSNKALFISRIDRLFMNFSSYGSNFFHEKDSIKEQLKESVLLLIKDEESQEFLHVLSNLDAVVRRKVIHHFSTHEEAAKNIKPRLIRTPIQYDQYMRTYLNSMLRFLTLMIPTSSNTPVVFEKTLLRWLKQEQKETNDSLFYLESNARELFELFWKAGIVNIYTLENSEDIYLFPHPTEFFEAIEHLSST